MTTINNFNTLPFIDALKAFFSELNVPVNYLDDKPTSAKAFLTDTYKVKDPYNLIGDVYFLGIVDDVAFNKSGSIAIDTIKKDL